MPKNAKNMVKILQHIPHIFKLLKINILIKKYVLESVRNVLELVGTLKIFQHIPTHFRPFLALSTPYLIENQYVLDVLEVLETKSLLRARARGVFCLFKHISVLCN